MDSLLNFLQWNLSDSEWLTHGVIFAVNLLLLALAPLIFCWMEPESERLSRVKIFRALNLAIVLLHGIDLLLLGLKNDYEHYFIKLGLSLITIYVAILAYSLACLFTRRRFGRVREFDDQKVYLDTYSTRLIDLILLVIIVITTIVSLVRLWGADSLLETTGILGILAAFLAFTSNVWAPDIISGLIILNTQMLEDGDVVLVDGYPDEYIINKVSFIHVSLLDVRNNHRSLMRNSHFIKSKIDNLSRNASMDGMRRTLVYKIGYPNFSSLEGEERSKALARFKSRVESMFNGAYESCCEDKDVRINRKREFSWALTSAGDHALEYSLYIYLERLPNTKVTSTIRKHLYKSVHSVNEAVYSQSIEQGLDLSTPIQAQLIMEQTPPFMPS